MNTYGWKSLFSYLRECGNHAPGLFLSPLSASKSDASLSAQFKQAIFVHIIVLLFRAKRVIYGYEFFIGGRTNDQKRRKPEDISGHGAALQNK
jgi:hypothetical protein